MTGSLNPWPFYSCSVTFYIGVLHYEDMLVMHIPFSTRFNGSYQYYFHQYCKLIELDYKQIALTSSCNISAFPTLHSLRKVKKNQKSYCKHFNIDIYLCIYMKCNKIKISSVYSSVINSNNTYTKCQQIHVNKVRVDSVLHFLRKRAKRDRPFELRSKK